MAGYTKLFSSIIASTVWRLDDKTRIVWITMLAMADKDGMIEGSVPGLADMARVSIEECEEALVILENPDKHSRSKEDEGRRIRTVEGGWWLVNHAKYRAKMMSEEKREYWKKQKQKQRENVPDVQDVPDMSAQSRKSHGRSGADTGDGEGLDDGDVEEQRF